MADPNVTGTPETPVAGAATVEKPAVTGAVTGTPDPNASTQVTSPAKKEGEADANKGILADLQKERKARQGFEKQIADINSRLAERDRQIQALTGAKVDTPEEADVKAVRDRFAQLYPGLAKLTDEQIDKLLSVADNAGNLQDTTLHYWTQHGQTMINAVASEVAKELGGEKLTERQLKNVARAYIKEAEDNPQFLERHQRGDKTLVSEFAKEWVEDWFEPARRKMTQTVVGRGGRPVPKSGPSSPVTTNQPATPKTLDEVTDRAVAYLKERGQMVG